MKKSPPKKPRSTNGNPAVRSGTVVAALQQHIASLLDRHGIITKAMRFQEGYANDDEPVLLVFGISRQRQPFVEQILLADPYSHAYRREWDFGAVPPILILEPRL